MAMRETEVGCFLRLYDKYIRELNLQNIDGTGFSVVLSPAFPFVTPDGVPESSGYQMPGNELAKVTPPEITIHTIRRTLPERYQNNFISDIIGDEGTEHEGFVVGKVYSQEVDVTLQISVWAEDPRQREFLKIQIEKPFINRKKMTRLLASIGAQNGWQDGFVVQNIAMTHRGDLTFNPQSSTVDVQDGIGDGDFIPRIYTGLYDVSFTTEIRDKDYIYGEDTIFDIKELSESGLDPLDYDMQDPLSVSALIIDLMQYYGLSISPVTTEGQPKPLTEIVRESAVEYGNSYKIYVDSYNFMESLYKITFGPILSSKINLQSGGVGVGEIEG